MDLNDSTSLEKTIEVMNALSKEYYVETPRYFEMDERCGLKIRTGIFFKMKTRTFQLNHTQVRIESPENKRVYVVKLYPNKDEQDQLVILDNAPFFDAHRMSWLVRHAKAICRE